MGGSEEKQEALQQEAPRISSATRIQVQEAYAALQGRLTGLPPHRQHSAHERAGPPEPASPSRATKLLQALERRSRRPGGRQ
jgi:hypothetical protein